MSVKLETVLAWAERVAAAVSIAVPAVRQIVSVLDTREVEMVLIERDED